MGRVTAMSKHGPVEFEIDTRLVAKLAKQAARRAAKAAAKARGSASHHALPLRAASVIDAWPTEDTRRAKHGAGKYRTPSMSYLMGGHATRKTEDVAPRVRAKRVRVRGKIVGPSADSQRES